MSLQLQVILGLDSRDAAIAGVVGGGHGRGAGGRRRRRERTRPTLTTAIVDALTSAGATGVELGLFQVPRHGIHGGRPATVQQGIRSDAAPRASCQLKQQSAAGWRWRRGCSPGRGIGGRRGGERTVPGKQIAGLTVGRRQKSLAAWAATPSWELGGDGDDLKAAGVELVLGIAPDADPLSEVPVSLFLFL